MRRLLTPALVGVGCFALSAAAAAFELEPSGPTVVLPVAGFALAVLLVADKDRPALLAAIVIGACGAGLALGESAPVAAGLAAVIGFQAAFGAWLLERTSGRPFVLTSEHGPIAFMALAMAGASALGAIPAAAILVADAGEVYWVAWLEWWAATGAGTLTLAPVVLAVCRPRGPAPHPRRLVEGAVAVCALAGVTAFVFSRDAGADMTLLDRPVVLVPGLVLIAVRYDNRILGAAVATFAGITAGLTAGGMGPYATPGTSAGAEVLELQAFLGVTIGTVLGIAGILGERRRIAAALRASEARAKEVVEGAHEAFVSINAAGLIVGWNAEAERLFGWPREEAMGRELAATIIPERFRDDHRRGLRRFLETGETRMAERLLELNVLRRDGSELPVELTISSQRLPDGAWVFNAFIRDVSERMAAQGVLQVQGAIIAEMTEGVALVRKRDRTIVYVNPAFEHMFGYPPGELVGRPVSVLSASSPPDAAETVSEFQELGDSPWSGEVRSVRRDGSRFWARTNLTDFDHPQFGEVFLAVHTDITERRRMQHELERSNEELEQFAYLASHDLSEPLRVVAGFVELLQRRYEGRLDERADKYITATVDGVDRMQAMIDALLQYSRAGRAAPEVQAVDCTSAVNEAVTVLARLIDERHAVVEVHDLPTVAADPVLLAEVFQNLISNAIKHGDSDAPRVEIGAVRANSHWVISVEDNGPGIDPAHADRVFEMFQRLGGERPGAGIGLALCRRIIEKHRGRIWVEPRPGGGSSFRFTLAAAPEAATPERQSAVAA